MRLNFPSRNWSLSPTWLSLFLLTAITGFVFFSTLKHPFIYYDVEAYVTANPMIRQGFTPFTLNWAFTTMRTGDWQPLIWLSFMLDYQLFGLNPAGFHGMNLFWHLMNVFLVFVVFSRLTGRVKASLALALFFAIHPLKVESVAWVAERKDLVSGFFWWLTIGFYAAAKNNKERKFELLAILTYILAILSKPVVVSLPLILLLLDFWPLNRWHSRSYLWPLLKEKTIYILLAFLSCTMALIANSEVRGIISLDSLPPGMRLQNVIISYCAYLKKTVLPLDLAIIYPFPIVKGYPLWLLWTCTLLLAGITVTVIKVRKRSPFLAVGWFWYLITLVPVIGIVQVGVQSMADRYTYLPHAGLGLMITWGILQIPWASLRKAGICTGFIGLSIFAVLSKKQVHHWRSPLALQEHAAQVVPDNYIAHSNLGYAYMKAGEFDKALEHLGKALKIFPRHLYSIGRVAMIYHKQGRIEEAERLYKLALTLNPRHSISNNNLGSIYLKRGDEKNAEFYFLQAIAHGSARLNARKNLARLYIRQGRIMDARHLLDIVLARYPKDKDALYMRGIIASRRGNAERAKSLYQKTIETNPESIRARNNLAGLYLQEGKMKEAEQLLREAVSAQPTAPEPYINLSVLLIHEKRAPEAIPLLKQALKISPDSSIARDLLGKASAPDAEAFDIKFKFETPAQEKSEPLLDAGIPQTSNP